MFYDSVHSHIEGREGHARAQTHAHKNSSYANARRNTGYVHSSGLGSAFNGRDDQKHRRVSADCGGGGGSSVATGFFAHQNVEWGAWRCPYVVAVVMIL